MCRRRLHFITGNEPTTASSSTCRPSSLDSKPFDCCQPESTVTRGRVAQRTQSCACQTSRHTPFIAIFIACKMPAMSAFHVMMIVASPSPVSLNTSFACRGVRSVRTSHDLMRTNSLSWRICGSGSRHNGQELALLSHARAQLSCMRCRQACSVVHESSPWERQMQQGLSSISLSIGSVVT